MISEEIKTLNKNLELKGYKYLGSENDWGRSVPDSYFFCKEIEEHQLKGASDSFGNHIHYCDICRIYFQMDSGD